MIEELRPRKGGFLRPFGCAQFIISFLKGEGPNGSAKIDPGVGAPQTDIRYEYKQALHRSIAEDMVAREEEKRIARKLPPLTAEQAELKRAAYFERLPGKFISTRYHSFLVYFGLLKRLGWVEPGKEEPSTIQEYYPAAPPRRYYRLTTAGRLATPSEISDPITLLYGYPREVRSAKKQAS